MARRVRLRSWLLGVTAVSSAAAWLACTAFDDGAAPGHDAGLDTGATPPSDGASPSDAAPSDASSDGAASCVAPGGVSAAIGCPRVVASDQKSPLHVVITAGRVFWTSFGDALQKGAVRSATLDGKDIEELVSPLVGYHPKYMAAAAGYVYWGEQATLTEQDALGKVHRTRVDGGVLEDIPHPTGYTPRAIAATADAVYYQTWNGEVRSHTFATDAGALLGAGGTSLSDLDVDSAGLVVAQAGNGTSNKGALIGKTFDGVTSLPNLTNRDAYPWGVRISGLTVYWVERGSLDGGPPNAGALLGGPRTGSSVGAVLCSGLPSPLFVAVDDTYVYVTVEGFSATDGELRRVKKDASGACELMVSGLARPHGIAASPTHLCWTTRGDGRVWCMEKP